MNDLARSGRKARKKSISFPGMGGLKIVEVEMVDPYDPTRRERVKKAVRDHTLDAIALAGHLRQGERRGDNTEARMEAARRYLETYLAASGKGVPAVDYSRVVVDTSPFYDGTPEYQAAALKKMARITDEIGQFQQSLLHKTIVLEIPVRIQIRNYTLSTARACALFYLQLRDALDAVIRIDSIAVGRSAHRILSAQDINA